MPTASVLAHEGLPFANPMAEADVEEAVAALALPDGARVLESGCGSAELLIRVLERWPEATGVGVDPDLDWLARARTAAARRLPGRNVTFVEATAAAAGLPAAGFDAVVNVAASHAHGGYPAALPSLAALVRPGGAVLLGEGFWAHDPSPAFLDALGGATRDELGTLDELLDHARRAGLEPLMTRVASANDWARYEETLAANAERHAHPDSLAYARVIRQRRALLDGTDTLGFALIVARRER